MNKYIAQLLAVELPSFEVAEAEKDALIISSVCMSVPSIKIIHETMHKNIESVKQIKENFAKYVTRVQFSIENRDITLPYEDIFKPTEKTFKYAQVDSLLPPTKEEFQLATHYILFQDVHINEIKGEEISLGKWQNCLVNLLLETDLTSYCSQLGGPNHGEGSNSLTDMMWQIHSSPTGYLINSERLGQVKVMAYFLWQYFKTAGEEYAMKELEALCNHFRSTVENFLERQQNVEQTLRLTINALSNRINNIKTETIRFNSDIFQCILARRFWTQYTCMYEITKVSMAALKSTDKKRCSVIIRGDFGKYAINFVEFDKKLKAKKGATQSAVKSQKIIE